MTESRQLDGIEWRDSVDVEAMLMHLRLTRAGTDRQWRLFACACARRVWDLLSPSGQAAVVAAEEFCDGVPLPRSLQEIGYRVLSAAGTSEEARRARNEAAAAARHCTDMDPVYAGQAGKSAANAEGWNAATGLPRAVLVRPHWERARNLAREYQAGLLRDLFTPFHPPLHIEPAWLSWDRGTVRNMAEVIDRERDYTRLPVLADALEDAGCTEPLILAHCREDQVHTRGCWVVERLLGRECR
jgi:hypothetical protein